VRLNWLGRAGMNNPARAALLRRYVTRRLWQLDPQPARRTLVIGCGQGVDIEIAYKTFRAYQVVAIDLDERQVRRARRRLGDDTRTLIALGDARALPFPAASVDTVVDLGAIHLVPEWHHAVEEVARVLAPSGRFLFEEIVGRSYRAVLPLSTEGLRSPNRTGFGRTAFLSALDMAGLKVTPADLFEPRMEVLTGLVGDLIGVARRPWRDFTADDVIEVVSVLAAAGARFWLDGGWGIDALLGRQTRMHDDLDMAVAAEDIATAVAALGRLGFGVEEDARPVRLVLVDGRERQVDLHPLEFDVLGNGVQRGAGPNGVGDALYPAKDLQTGSIAERPVPCLSATLQLAHHTGYVPRTKEREDVAALCADFGLEPPSAYSTSPLRVRPHELDE
jgi:lincosamide nucleotidyltransferase A/C/D/E